MFFKKIVVTLFFMVLVFCNLSCTKTKIFSDPPDPAKLAEKDGLRYYVGKDVLVLDVKRTSSKITTIDEALDLTGKEEVDYDGKVSFITIPDLDHTFSLRIVPGSSDASKIKLELSEMGLFKSINFESAGKGGEILKNSFSFLGTLASFISPVKMPLLTSLVGAKSGPPNKCQKSIRIADTSKIKGFFELPKNVRLFLQSNDQAVMNWNEIFKFKENIANLYSAKADLLEQIKSSNEDKLKEINKKLDEINKGLEKQVARRDELVSQFQSMLNEFKEREGLGKKIDMEEFSKQLNIPEIPSLISANNIQNKINTLKNEIDKYKTILTGKTEKISINEFLEEINYSEFIEINKKSINLCSITDKISSDKTNLIDKEINNIDASNLSKNSKECLKNVLDELKKELTNWENKLKLYENMGVTEIDIMVVKHFMQDMSGLKTILNRQIRNSALEIISSEIVKKDSNKEVYSFFKDSGVLVFIDHLSKFGSDLPMDAAVNNKDDKGSRIFYRQTIPIRVMFFSIDSKSNLVRFYETIVHALHPCMPIYHIKFAANAFATRNLGMVFDAKGRPMILEQTSTSSMEKISSSLAESLKTARDEYSDSLKKISEIQETQRKIKLDPISTKIEQLKKEKEALDAQLSLQTSSQSYDYLLKQKQLENELNILQAQLKLEEAQQTKDQELEIAMLKAELEKLRTELEILKIQIEIKKNDGN